MPTKETAELGEAQNLGVMVRNLIEAVPETDSSDAQYRIAQQILFAKDVSELDQPWSGTAGLGEYNGQEIVIHSIRRAPSSFKAGTGVFLILDVEQATGEHTVVTTGSVSVVVQLLKAYDLNAFPLRVIPRVSDRESSNGYYPQHLEIVTAESA